MSGELREIAGLPGYFVSADGRVFSTRNRWGRTAPRELRQHGGRKKGYRRITIRDGSGKPRHFEAHRLVAAAFIGPCPPGLQVNHIDGDPSNNAPENLEYVSALDNLRHAARLGRSQGVKLTFAAAAEIKAAPRGSAPALAKKFGVSQSTVYDVIIGRRWRAA